MSAKSVIEIWLSGGPSSLETFDPKPDAPVDYNNGLKAIDTNVPGLRLHEWWPELAKCADLFSLVRTMTHPHAGHETATYLMQTGRNPGGFEVYPAIGTVISMIKAKEYRGDLPPSVILTGAKGRFSETGFLGERHAPLVTGGNPNAHRFVVDGIVPPGGLSKAEIERRFDLLATVDRFGDPSDFKDFDDAGTAARHVIEGDAAKTFDLSKEPDEIRTRYGRTWLGQTLLVARRLVEYGVPYVTVNVNGWDTHKRHFETIRQRSAETDRAVAALLGDLKARGLLDTTLVWMSGEFGRTTKIDRDPPWNGGRGHYSKCFCALVAGGGFKGGQVVGESDATASTVKTRPVTPVDFLGSIYELCGIDPEGVMPNHAGKKVTILPKPSKAGRLKELYRHLAAFAALLALPALNAAEPYVGYIYPSSIRAGSTNRVIVGGQNFFRIREGVLTGNGVRILNVESVPNFPPAGGQQRNFLLKWLKGISNGNPEKPAYPENARLDEWRSNVWWNALGTLDRQKISLVELDLFTPRNALQMTPSLRQRLLVTIAADPDTRPGVRELRLFGGNGMSPPRPFIVTTETHVEEPLFAAPFREQPDPPRISSFPTVLDGQILPGQTDRWEFSLRKGIPVTFRTVAREFQPYIGDAVPGFFNPVLTIFDTHGKEVAFADDLRYHPDPVLTFTPPQDGLYTLAIRDALYRGREDFVYALFVTENAPTPKVADVPLWRKPEYAIPVSASVADFAGSIGANGAVQSHKLEITRPGEYVFDLLARRAGSPLDGKVEVFGPKGHRLALFTDTTNAVHCGSIIQGECDPIGRLKLPAAGIYTVKVSDEAGKGGAEWTYRLRVHHPAPRFEVLLSPSSFALHPGDRRLAHVTVLRHDGFRGQVKLKAPPPLELRPSVIPAGSNTLSIAVISRAKGTHPPVPVEISASATFDGYLTRVPVIPCDEYNQAFAWDHLLPARTFLFKALPALPRRNKRR